MELTDALVDTLNAIVAPKPFLGKSTSSAVTDVDLSYSQSAANMKVLTAELKGYTIKCCDLQLGDAVHVVERTSPTVPEHVVLHAPGPFQLDWNQIWTRLQCGSPHCEGTHPQPAFGDLNDEEAFEQCAAVLEDRTFATNLRHISNVTLPELLPPPSIAERVVLCLRVLSSLGTTATKPAAYQVAQRLLSQTLLDYPVLMHPRILMPVFKSGLVEYMSVLHAVAISSAGLPRRSHFSEENVENKGLKGLNVFNPERGHGSLTSRLESFAKHPCVRLALRQQSAMHISAEPKSQKLVRKPQRLIPFAISLSTTRVQFLASVFEMEQFFHPAPVVPMESWHAVETSSSRLSDSDAVERIQLLRCLARTIIPASGLVQISSGKSSSIVVEGLGREQMVNTNVPDTGFLQGIARSLPVLSRNAAFLDAIVDAVSRKIFMDRFNMSMGPQDVRFNTKAMIAGLASIGINAPNAPNAAGPGPAPVSGSPDSITNTSPERLAAAAAFVLDAVIGTSRVNRNLSFPTVGVESAFAFIESVYAAGGLGTIDSGQIDHASILVHSFPDYSTPYRNEWTQALDAFKTELLMKSVIARVRGNQMVLDLEDDALHGASSAQDAVVQATKPEEPVRRRRMTV